MTAKEMFEKIGYECDIDFVGTFTHERCIRYVKLEEKIDTKYIINFYDKTICTNSVDIVSNTTDFMELSIRELQAINKQVEELEWNK